MDVGAAKRVARRPSENIFAAGMVKLCTGKSRVIRQARHRILSVHAVPLLRSFRISVNVTSDLPSVV